MKISTIAALVSLAVMPVVASASGFIDETSNNPFSAHRQVRVIGTHNFQPVFGFANGVTLEEAVRSIVPKSYTLTADDLGADAQRRVDWRGGHGWDRVLTTVLAQAPNVRAEINASDKRVRVYVPGAAAPTPSASAQPAAAPKKREDAESGIREEVVATAATPVKSQAPEVSKTWNVRAGSSLRETLNDWSRKEGWQDVAWELGEDFVLGASASFVGALPDAVDALVSSVRGAGDVRVEIYQGNRVMRVTNKARGVN